MKNIKAIRQNPAARIATNRGDEATGPTGAGQPTEAYGIRTELAICHPGGETPTTGICRVVSAFFFTARDQW